MLCSSILEAIGNTPLVKFQRIANDLPANVYGKCEFMNPGGSVKDRSALQMIEDAEKSGRIKQGDVLIEPSSGNMGIRGGSANPDIELSEISASMGDGNRLPRSRSNEKTPP